MLDNIITIITGPNVAKTKDPAYSKAKHKLKKILNEAERIDEIIYSIEHFEKTLQSLSDATYILGKDIRDNFSDAPEEDKLKAKANFNISKHFCALTKNFFIPRIDTNVITSLTKIKEKANKLNDLKDYVKILRREFDLSRAVVNDYYTNNSIDEEKMKEVTNKMNKDKENYTKLNEKFINSVNKLKKRRKTIFHVPVKNMICLMSQYMMLVFSEIQKYRSTFPPDLFVTKKSLNC